VHYITNEEVPCKAYVAHDHSFIQTIIVTMDRPRRTVRQPIKPPQTIAPEPTARATKRSLPTPDPADHLKMLLESTKSDLVSLDMNVRTCVIFPVFCLGLILW
jgi:hypothetical protein